MPVTRLRQQLLLPSSSTQRKGEPPYACRVPLPWPLLDVAFDIDVATLPHRMQIGDTIHACTANNGDTCNRTFQTWQSMNLQSPPPPTAWLFSKQYERRPTNSTFETRNSHTLLLRCTAAMVAPAACRNHDSSWHPNDMRRPNSALPVFFLTFWPHDSGRGVAGYFEKLLPREGNEDYYRRIHMPVSLRVIERRLYRHELANMTQLESWMKRMVNNAKEYYSRGSQTYEDAERVRKATSNYMVKTNPAYKKIPNYAATPAAAPSDWDVDAEIAAEDMPSELAASDAASRPSRPPQPQQPTGEEDAEGEDEDMPDADAEADDGEAAEGDADISRGSNTRIVLKRRGARSSGTEDTPDARSTSDNKSGAQFSEVPYQGLNFQQAQEKLVDELSTRQEEEYVTDFEH